ncbi:MAG: YdcF family protein [Chlorobium sp.]|uniref:YdcF family protein n=1 Tax=Chlorobium sp. TaxID=1095 RepID=UPI0025BF836A|nr:YdcF family protein [Chlorobium sp.]MCF8382818.1 YdcF family protein [Chlorobium sp.]
MIKAFFHFITFVLLSLASLAGVVFLCLGFVVSFPAQEPEKADVIVVLGGDSGLRVEKGAELYKEGFAPKVLLTGIDARFYRPGHPNWRERRMRALGVPKKAIKVDTESETTWEEAVNASETLHKNGWKSAIVVSDPPHMLRIHQTWSRVFEGSSKKIILVPTEPDWWNTLLWWKNKTSYRFVISEIKKNAYYYAVYL